MYRVTASRVVRTQTKARISGAQRRTLATSSGTKQETAATTGGNTALLVGGVTILGAIGYYMTRRDDTKYPSAEDAKNKAKDAAYTAKEAAKGSAQDARAKGESLSQDAKSQVQEEVDRARGSADSLAARAKAEAVSVKEAAERRAREAKAGVERRAEGVRDAVVGVKDEAGREAEKVKNAGTSWFSWGKDKAEETKEDAAKGVARQAESVRVSADKRA